MTAEKPLPTGSKFLYGTSVERLKEMQRSEKDPKAAKRLLVFIKRKGNMSIRKICDLMNMSYTTVRQWLWRATDMGLKGRYDKVRPGMQCKLDDSQLECLRADLIAGPQKCGFTSNVWTARLVLIYVKKKYGVMYANSGMYDLLHRIGFSCKKPRPRHPKAASESEKKAFKRRSASIIRYYTKKGYTIFAEDEVSCIIGWNVKNGWYLKGKPVTTPVSLSRQRFHSFGVLSADTLYCRFYDKTGGDNFYDFLKALHQKFGKVLIFLDNASYHKSVWLKQKLKNFKRDVVLKYLPPYTPELNPVEGQWRLLKKATANTLYEDTDEMQDSIVDMIKNGEIPVAKMSDYLT